MTDSSRRSALPLLALATAALVALAVWLFPQAMPNIALEQTLTSETAVSRARAFAASHGLPVAETRSAVRFSHDDDVQVFLELEAGGKAQVNREVRGRDVALFSWDVRFFRPGDPREVRVTLGTDGRVIGFQRELAQADPRPTLDSAAALALADSVRRAWLADTADRWRLVSTSVATVKPSERVDRTVTYERTDRTLGKAPLRLDVLVRGDLASGARAYVQIPEAFTRRYGERRADNDLYANIASAFVPLYLLLAVVAFWGAAKRRAIRWRPAAIGGAIIGVLAGAAALNGIPLGWFGYDTAQTVSAHLGLEVLGAISATLGLGLFATVLLAMGEFLTRDAFPQHFDWWQTRAQAGTRPVATRVLAGYTLAAFGLAYVSVFYFVAERGLGWWSPSSIMDDPNQIAAPFPWLSAVATSLQAGVMEEVLFRAIPLALLARATAGRSWQRMAMGGGVVLTALVFGFAHANYASWPAYARGVELFVEAALWAVLYLRVGLVTTIVGHFTYDLVLFGLFTSAGTAMPYRISLAVVALVAAVPALVVAVQAWRRGGLAPDTPDSARFGAWQQGEAPPAAVPEKAVVAGPLRVNAWTWAALGLTCLVGIPSWVPRATPGFSVDRSRAEAIADSLVRTLGASPEAWTRLAEASPNEQSGIRRFLRAKGADSLTSRIARPWLLPGEWTVRYVHTNGTVGERTESWRVTLAPDGGVVAWSHVLPESLGAPAISRDSAERAARAALAAVGANATGLALVSAADTARPARRDVSFVFDDTTARLPGGAAVRWTAVVAGDRVRRTGHTLFLPEAWEREEAARSSSRGVLIGGIALVLVLGGVVALVLVMRRAPSVPAMAWPSVGRGAAFAAAAGVVWALWSANGWPEVMATWDTATPFNRHQWTALLGLLGAAVGPAGLLVLWRLVDALRQRVGVVVEAASLQDALVTGGALALATKLPGLIPTLLLPPVPLAADTSMDTVLPWANMALSSFSGGLGAAALVALVAGAMMVARRPVARVALVGVACVLVAVMSGAAGALDTTQWIQRGAADAAGYALAIGVVWRFGRSSLQAWMAGGVLAMCVGDVSAALAAAAPIDAVSHIVGASVSLGLLVVVLRRVRGVADVPSA
jgi:hypothetical protein